MITVELFGDALGNVMGWDERDQARVQRSLSAAKALSKINTAPGPGLYLKAAESVLDLVRAYADYRQAREITQQLMVEGETLVRLIQEQLSQQEIDRQLQSDEAAARHARSKLRLDERVADNQLIQGKLLAFSRQAKKFGQVLVLHRESAPPRCPQFAALEEAYYRFMDINLKLTMNLLDSRTTTAPSSARETP